MRRINIDDVLPGDIIAQDIENANGVLLIRKGTVLTVQTLVKLRQFKMDSIYIDDALSEGIELLTPIKQETINRIKHTLIMLDIDGILENAKTLVHELSDSLFEADMQLIQEYDDYTKQHSINVAIYAATLAKTIGFSIRTVELIAQAALLHDIGKLQIPGEIIKKPSKLTTEEYEIVRTHPQLGYDLLKNRWDIWSVVRVGVWEHHENIDGSGYPRHLKGNEIHTIGRILRICDAFDAAKAKRIYKESKSVKTVMEELKDKAGTLYDTQYIELFVRCIPFYPKGTLVQLSNGERGIVVRNNPIHTDRPIIKLSDGTPIDLLNSQPYLDVEVTNILQRIDQPELRIKLSS